jgi:DNA polymerase-3 subunit delta'
VWSIIGHAAPLEVLQRAIDSGHPAHAWLFAGPEGIGKRSVALEFAAALNCEQPEPPCGCCRACMSILAGSHPDVEIIEPGGICDEPEHKDHADSRDLRICQVRRVERILSLSPYAGRHRVAIIDGADTLRTEAANAFLKTLEEPAGEAIIVLLVEREERLPETIQSRCSRLAFRPVDRDLVVQALLDRGADAAQAETIASVAGGRIGWAIRALSDPGLLGERDRILDDIVRLAHAPRAERLAWARDAGARGSDVRLRYQGELGVWAEWWRDVLQAGAGNLEGLINRERLPQLEVEGKLYRAGEVVRFLGGLLQTREYLQANVDAQLALENLMLDLPSPQSRTAAR